MVLDVDKDKTDGLRKTHSQSLNVIQEFCDHFDLTDVWRVLNADSRQYTWRQEKPEVHCRLDFFLVSQSLKCNIMNTDIFPGYKNRPFNDYVRSYFNSKQKGRGFWELKPSFLKQLNYVDEVKTTIKKGRRRIPRNNKSRSTLGNNKNESA